MTEAEWLAATDPQAMLAAVEGKASPRRLRLFACACCRLMGNLLADRRVRIALRKLEEYADDLGNDKLRRDAYNTANSVYGGVRLML